MTRKIGTNCDLTGRSRFHSNIGRFCLPPSSEEIWSSFTKTQCKQAFNRLFFYFQGRSLDIYLHPFGQRLSSHYFPKFLHFVLTPRGWRFVIGFVGFLTESSQFSSDHFPRDLVVPRKMKGLNRGSCSIATCFKILRCYIWRVWKCLPRF